MSDDTTREGRRREALRRALTAVGFEVTELRLTRLLDLLNRDGYRFTQSAFGYREEARESYAAAREARKAEALAEAIPYSGAISQCQADVAAAGRAIVFYRCTRRARFVVRRRSDPKGDGRLAVCKQHAGDPTSSRHRKISYGDQPTADEVVEQEYQP